MAMGTGASGNSLRGPRDRNRPRSRLRGPRQAPVLRVELEGLETRALHGHDPGGDGDGQPAEPLDDDGQHRRHRTPARTARRWPSTRTTRRSSWRSGSTTTRRWPRPRTAMLHRAGGGLLGRRRPDLAAAVLRADQHGEPPDRIRPLLDPTTTGPTLPYAYVTTPTPGLRQQQQLLHPDRVPGRRHGRRLGQRRAGAAEVRLLRLHADGRPVHQQPAGPESLPRLPPTEPEGHLPVVHLGQQ